MRNPEENRIYMREYMKKKYATQTEQIKIRNKLSYEKNRYSNLKQKRRIDKTIDRLYDDLVNSVNNSDKNDEEIDEIYDLAIERLEELLSHLKTDEPDA